MWLSLRTASSLVSIFPLSVREEIPALPSPALAASQPALLGGSWAVISRVTILITHNRGLITPLITTLNPTSYRTLTRTLKGDFKPQL